MSDFHFILIAITFVAATVNGALGYGFSSITVPLALLFLSNRVLNPALVMIEVVLNAHVLWINRASVPAVWKRVLPIVIGLTPGVIAGTFIIAYVSPAWLKLATYVTLLPLILAQASGWRRPIASERLFGLAFGSGLGVLYAVTTISGPPLAAAFSNQGLVKREFRAALALVRLAESSLTLIAYGATGLLTVESVGLIPYLVPGIVLGVPLGAIVIHRVQPETFRRVCMSFDAWVVAFGTSRVLAELRLVAEPAAYAVLIVVAAIDIALLVRFFSSAAPAPQIATVGPSGARRLAETTHSAQGTSPAARSA